MKYRHVWPGVLLLSALVLCLGSLLVWGDRFLTPSPAGGIGHLLLLRLPSTVTLDAAASQVTPLPWAESGTASQSVAEPPSPVSDRSAHDDPRPSAVRGAAQAVEWPPLSHTRYALELGTFAIDEDAERAEAQLNQAGFSTVRFRQQRPVRLYTVAVRQSAAERQSPSDDVERDGTAQPAAVTQAERQVSPVATALPLRAAVMLAERLRSAGYEVKILAEAAQMAQITLRHGNFASRREAEAVSRQISGIGVPNEIVSVP